MYAKHALFRSLLLILIFKHYYFKHPILPSLASRGLSLECREPRPEYSPLPSIQAFSRASEKSGLHKSYAQFCDISGLKQSNSQFFVKSGLHQSNDFMINQVCIWVTVLLMINQACNLVVVFHKINQGCTSYNFMINQACTRVMIS